MYIHLLGHFKSEWLTHVRKEDLQFLKQVSKLNYHLKKRIEIVWCTPFPKLRNSLLLLSFSEFFNTDAFCRKTNLTSNHEILTGKRQFDELSFKRSLVAERKLGPELWTITLTLPPMENALVDYTHIELHAGKAYFLFICNYYDKRAFFFCISSHLCE